MMNNLYSKARRGRPIGGPQGIPARLEAYSIPVPECGCQIWFGRIDKKGYGRLSVEGKKALAHRLAWRLRHGEIPSGIFVLHRCDTPACINVDHLFLGNNDDNVADMVSKNRQAVGTKNGTSKLTDAAVADIRSSQASGLALAAKYGVSRELVYMVRSRRIWRHLP